MSTVNNPAGNVAETADPLAACDETTDDRDLASLHAGLPRHTTGIRPHPDDEADDDQAHFAAHGKRELRASKDRRRRPRRPSDRLLAAATAIWSTPEPPSATTCEQARIARRRGEAAVIQTHQPDIRAASLSRAVSGRTRSRRALLVGSALLAVSVVGLAEPAAGDAGGARGRVPSGPPDTFVAAWDAIGVQAFSAAALTPAEGHTIFGYVAVAVYDSVMAIEGGYEPFAVDADAPEDASAEAAVAAAAHRILVHHLPAQSGILDSAYAASLDGIPDGPAEVAGVATGEDVAARLIALRAGDGFRAPVTYTPPNPPVPGVWIPTGPTPIGPYLGLMEPFSLDSADQFRPDGPPDLRSRKWAREYDEVKDIGSSTSATRTTEQTATARFWGEPPVQQARGSFRKFVVDHQLDIVAASRFMAMVSVVYADALIACFDAKYHFASWRPITAIRAGNTDDNTRTVGDPDWSPLLPATPNHPEYPSAHSCITPAGGRVIARFLRTQSIDFAIPSVTGLGDRYYGTVRDLQDEVGDARVWGGVHFRSAVNDGVAIGRQVAQHVLANHFRRTSS